MELIGQFLLPAAFFIPLEHFFWQKRQKIFRLHWLNDCVFWCANIFLVAIPAILILKSATDAGKFYLPALRQAIAFQPGWVQFLECMLLADTGLYLAHRTVHTIPFLWRFHSIHHSAEELDWLVSVRTHPLDQILLKSASLLPMFLSGFSCDVITAYLLFATWQTFLTHSNIKLIFGPGLRWFLAGPEFHRWHHDKNCTESGKNFAGHFPFFDLVLGTAHMPKGVAPDELGIKEQMRQSYVKQLIMPLLIRRQIAQEFTIAQHAARSDLGV